MDGTPHLGGVNGTRAGVNAIRVFGKCRGGDRVLVVHQVKIPEDMEAKLEICSKHLGIGLDALIVFAVVRFLEIQAWVFNLWR